MFGIEGKAGQYIELAIGTLLIVVVGLLLIKLILKVIKKALTKTTLDGAIDVYKRQGMVISGAYMGDKLSPMSDSTNVAAAAARTPLYDHVRAMMTTTIPSFCLALLIYLVLGFIIIDEQGYDIHLATDIQQTILDNFYISPWIVCPVLVLSLIHIFA